MAFKVAQNCDDRNAAPGFGKSVLFGCPGSLNPSTNSMDLRGVEPVRRPLNPDTAAFAIRIWLLVCILVTYEAVRGSIPKKILPLYWALNPKCCALCPKAGGVVEIRQEKGQL